MPEHPHLDEYLDDVQTALAALEKLGRIPRKAARAVADHFADLDIPTPLAVMELSAEEKLHFQKVALTEMVEHIENVDRELAEPEIYALLAPEVDPLFRLLASARAEEFNAEGFGGTTAEGSLESYLEESTGMSLDELTERISRDPHARALVEQVLLPGLTGLSIDDLRSTADHNPEVRDLLERLGLDSSW